MSVRILRGHVLDRLRELPDESAHCCVTSPPYYGLRDYGVAGQLGLESTLAEFLENMVAVFREVRRVLRGDGTLWLNIGDSYNAYNGNRGTESRYAGDRRAMEAAFPPGAGLSEKSLKPKDLMGVPWRLAFALQADGWYLRSDIIWHKKSTMPESVRDRPTKSHEHIFLLAKSESYYYDQVAASEPVEADTIPRYFRGRSDDHKNADGGPGDQTINRSFAHMVGIGHNKRERKAMQNAASRLLAEGANRRTGGAISGGVDASTLGVPAAVSRNWRDVWSLGPEPFKEAHFATFPTEIPRRAIVAGTSEKGCCASCGAPWIRFSEVVGRQVTDAMRYAGGNVAGEYHGEAVKEYEGTGAQNASDTKRRILERMGQVREHSWVRSCDCPPSDPVPATVLDPFLGSGTTALVADRLQRDCIGIELNPAYADMAERRIRGDAPLLAEVA